MRAAARKFSILGFAAAGLMLGAGSALAKDLKVVASVKPVHSLTAAIMEGAGQPQLIVKGGASPHSTSLRPSEAAALEQAEVVIWVGEGLETFLTGPLEALAENAKVVELAEAPGLLRLPYRAGGAWDDHEHEEHADEEHGHEEHAAHGSHADAGHHEEEHHLGGIDQHFWLDPLNARAMAEAIAAALVEADPENSDLYADNVRRLAARLEALTEEITADLAPVKDQPFVVFHDGFQYFDHRFDLSNVGSVTVDPEQQPGAQRLKEIQAKIVELNARCVFAEPQFEPKLIAVVIEGTAAKTGTLDPIGADIPDGPELYFDLLRSNAAALKACLGEAS